MKLATEGFSVVNNYFVDFWGAIIGDSAVSAYLHLKREADKNKEYCYINTEMIRLKMKKSQTELNEYLKTLEDFGFIIIFHRKEQIDSARLFKIRKHIPLLTDDLYNSLHPQLKELHDDFMSYYLDDEAMFNTNRKTTEDGIDNRNQIVTETSTKSGENKDYEIDRSYPVAKELNESFQQFMMTNLSRPSYETWIQGLIIGKTNELHYVIYATNEFSMEWIKVKYEGLIRQYITECIHCDENLIKISYRLIDHLAIEK
ncbi:hypothetical protein HOO54_17085 [Bacillus sp. WMMC1349]|uniref:DnaA N-terminal domain-containing protein n=1 Tax=Bacillus sp. WMMC1349 TaxID=2736254 RepID=UPI001555EEC2|nr:DnaA N-terminal domain-containing protein [Bacillus sp. WMMC1349]NPC93883.1 hypothetical protein [Bacillus sp. WMMC1349]